MRALGKAGFRVVREGKHVIPSDGQRLLTVPRAKRLNPYTLRSIFRSAGIEDQRFRQLLG